jgi:hypothetical protein
MAAHANPKKSSSGLVLALDAKNTKNYSSNRFVSYGTGQTTSNVAFNIQGTGTFQRIAAGTTINGYTVKASDVVYSYALGAHGCHYHGNSTSIPSGVYVTFTFDYLVTGATTYPVINLLGSLENYGGGGLGGEIAALNSTQNIWQRRSLTVGPTSSAGTQAAFLYPGACSSSRLADSGTIYYRNPKLEWTNTDSGSDFFSAIANNAVCTDSSGINNSATLTSPSAGMNSMIFSGVSDYATIGTTGFPFGSSPGTLDCWAKTSDTSVAAQWAISYGTATTSQSRSIGLVGSTYYFAGYTDDITYAGAANNVWFNLVGVYDGTNASMYLNGKLVSGPTAKSWNTVAGSAQLGRQTNGGEYWKGEISTTNVYNRALSANEIQQNFNALRGRFGI